MTNNSHISHTSFHLVVRSAECPIVFIFLYFQKNMFSGIVVCVCENFDVNPI